MVKAFYCAGTHWDREWYEPFQEYRRWLVDLIDGLMDLVESDPEYKCFHLDGQTIVLEDYLDIRPERKERLLSLLRARRIVVGPWYNLPDEWLISGESYVRNLMRGLRICRTLDVEPLRFAYTPDQFGHIAALPMIMAGFGLKAGICWRGTQDETHPAHFMWIGPDGSRMATYKLCDSGSYAPFQFKVRDQIKKDGFSEESYRKYFDPYIESEKGRSPLPLVLMLDAIDHHCPDPDMPRILRDLQRLHPDIEFVWGTLAQFGEELLRAGDQLPERRGELREPARDMHRGGQYLIVHTISSRYPIKRRNGQCQAILEKWAEPYALFEKMAGGAPIVRYVDKAWEYLLKNHPHDSICGCSLDQVHRDMQYRFDQCELLAEGVLKQAFVHIGKAAATPEALCNLVIHHPLPFARCAVVEMAVTFAHDWRPTLHDGLSQSEPVNRFHLVKKDGTRVPYQVSRIERGVEHKLLNSEGRCSMRGGDNIYHLAVEMDLPACGCTGIKVEPTEDATRTFGSLMTGPLSATNGLIHFALRPDGTAELVKCGPSDYAIFDLFTYEDCGDSGDGWTRGVLSKDVVFRGPGSRVSTAIDENGPLRAVFRVERLFDLPRDMDRRTWLRSEDRVPLRVTDRIYVEKGSPCLRVRTTVENTCKDHRFRVLFSTDCDTDVSFAETPFAVVERPIPIPPETAIWQERVNPEKPFTTFCGLGDADGGLALLAPSGPHEYEVTQGEARWLALTLFRSTFKTVATSGEPDGELLGTMEFEYLLWPFAGEFDAVQAARFVAEAQTGVRVHCTETLPDDFSFIRLQGNGAVVTAIKIADDGKGGVIRLWNPTDAPADDRIIPSVSVRTAEIVNLNEESVAPIALNSDGTIPISVPARGLVTVRFAWE